MKKLLLLLIFSIIITFQSCIETIEKSKQKKNYPEITKIAFGSCASENHPLPIFYNVVFQPEHFNIDVIQNEQSVEQVEKSTAIIGNIPGVQTNRLPVVEKPPIVTDNAEGLGRAFTGSYDPSKETLRNVDGKTFVFPKGLPADASASVGPT